MQEFKDNANVAQFIPPEMENNIKLMAMSKKRLHVDVQVTRRRMNDHGTMVSRGF